ncbi:MAG TPA: ribosome biogenesis GTP-binding protein YihA/YsxC [Stellaceae bacterium]|nr:ribosome biogenesis GTP-binding protein YihA/YsxC [Stellaceae bacterium]
MGHHAPRGRHLSAATAVYPPDAAPDAAAEERGRRLFAAACEFTAGAATADAIPPDSLPEVAFAGRSNVGKSSLINALTARTTLARVSRTPGRTRQINFFALGERLMLADLPGYGYAEASKREVERWGELQRLYLKGRASLRRVLLLVDARQGLKPADAPLMRTLDQAAVSYQVVLTKTDKMAEGALGARLLETAAALKHHVAAHPVIHLTSAHTGLGIAALRAALAALASDAVP